MALSASSVTMFTDLIYSLKYLKEGFEVSLLQGAIFYNIFTSPSDSLVTNTNNAQAFLENSGLISLYLVNPKVYALIIMINYVIGAGSFEFYEYFVIGFSLAAQFLQDFPDFLTLLLVNFVNPASTANDMSMTSILFNYVPYYMRYGTVVVMLANYLMGFLYLIFQTQNFNLGSAIFGLIGLVGVALDFVVLIAPTLMVDQVYFL